MRSLHHRVCKQLVITQWPFTLPTRHNMNVHRFVVLFALLVAATTASPAEWVRHETGHRLRGAERSNTNSPREINLRAVARSEGKPYSLCSFPRRHLLAISDVRIEPQNVKVGESVTVTLLGSLKKQVEDGTTDLSISYGIIPLKEQKSTVCKTMPCPVREGPFEYSQEFPIPPGTPNGRFTISYEVMAGEHERVTCVEFDLIVSS